MQKTYKYVILFFLLIGCDIKKGSQTEDNIPVSIKYYNSLVAQNIISETFSFCEDSSIAPEFIKLNDRWLVKDASVIDALKNNPKNITDIQIDEAQSNSSYQFSYTDTYLYLQKIAKDEHETSYETTIKYYSGINNTPILAINIYVRNEWRGWNSGGFAFFKLNNDTWINITDSIKNLPIPDSLISQNLDSNLLKKFNYLSPILGLNSENDIITYNIVSRSDFNCNNEWTDWDPLTELSEEITQQELQKICNQLNSVKTEQLPLKYKFDAIQMQFIQLK